MADNIQNIQYNNCVEEDEIDLRELWHTIASHKYKIIFITFFITALTIIYTLSVPNSYKSFVLLAPQEQSKPSISGGLASLAGMAGINIGGSSADVESVYEATLKDYGFNKMVLEKYNLTNKLSPEYMRKDMVFALGYSNLYDTIHEFLKSDNNKSKDEKIYDTYKQLKKKIISISSDKKTGLITLSAVTQDRFLSKELVDIYLKELTTYVKNREMKETDKKINYYKKELRNTTDVTLKEQISNLIASLMQKKVLSQANEYYNVTIINDAIVPYVKDKAKPKRALIVVVAFITSMILAIFWVFFIEFLKNSKEEDIDKS